jgi:nucleoside-diphosphate-sugar epimerase
MRGMRVAIIGATGNVGRALAPALLERGAKLVTIARRAERFRFLGYGTAQLALDLDRDGPLLKQVLAEVDCAINVAHVKHTRAIIKALPEPSLRLITLGSTRKFTRFPDQKAVQVMDAETAYAGVKGVILHPTMIYGGGDNNISRILRIVRRAPFVPMPQAGAALMQPIHRDDVVRALIAAIGQEVSGPPLVIAGAEALSYAALVKACGKAVGREVKIISIPIWGMRLLARMSRMTPGLPSVTADEVQRLLEDKAFDIAPMQARLGVSPCTFEEGLTRMRMAGEIAGRNAFQF